MLDGINFAKGNFTQDQPPSKLPSLEENEMKWNERKEKKNKKKDFSFCSFCGSELFNERQNRMGAITLARLDNFTNQPYLHHERLGFNG